MLRTRHLPKHSVVVSCQPGFLQSVNSSLNNVYAQLVLRRFSSAVRVNSIRLESGLQTPVRDLPSLTFICLLTVVAHASWYLLTAHQLAVLHAWWAYNERGRFALTVITAAFSRRTGRRQDSVVVSPDQRMVDGFTAFLPFDAHFSIRVQL